MRSLAVLILYMNLSSSTFGQTVITYVSTDVPLAIPDGPNGIAESHLTIPDYYWILDVNVVVSITHTYDQDLRIYLDGPNEDPDDDVVRLAYECGQSGDNYTNTRFDDEAGMVICAGAPPFTGSFRPDHSLELLDGRWTNGTWILRVTDNWNGDTGTIQAWSMEIEVDTTVAVREPPLATVFSIGQNYPNPFNPTTLLPIDLLRPERITLTIYNETGQIVQQGLHELTAGRTDLRIDGSNWSTGSYFAKVQANQETQTIRMLMLK